MATFLQEPASNKEKYVCLLRLAVAASKKKYALGTFLVVRGLRSCSPSAGAQVPSLVETRSHRVQLRVLMPQLKIPAYCYKDRRSSKPQLRPGAVKEIKISIFKNCSSGLPWWFTG